MFKKTALVVALVVAAGLTTVMLAAGAGFGQSQTPAPAPAVSQPATPPAQVTTPAAQPQPGGSPLATPPAATPGNQPAGPQATPPAAPTGSNPPAATPTVSPSDPDDEDPTASPNFDPFGGGAGSPQAGPSTGSGYPGDDSGGTPPPPDDPVPQNPVSKVYEDGKIKVMVGADRHFGHRIGDEIPLTILVQADDSVTLNFDAIRKGILAPDGQDFEVVGKPFARPVKQADGKTLWQVDITLRSFVPKKAIVFNADVLYSLEKTPDGKNLVWKRLTTPDFVVTTSNTADNGTDLLEGDQSPARNFLSWFTYPLLLVGLALTLLWPSLLFWRWYTRVHPPKYFTPAEMAWRAINGAFAEGKADGFKVKQYKVIASALRRYLGVEPATLTEVRNRLADNPQLPVIESALAKCEQVLYAKKPLADAQNDELLKELEQLIPKS